MTTVRIKRVTTLLPFLTVISSGNGAIPFRKCYPSGASTMCSEKGKTSFSALGSGILGESTTYIKESLLGSLSYPILIFDL
jgi:hypothetical protein